MQQQQTICAFDCTGSTYYSDSKYREKYYNFLIDQVKTTKAESVYLWGGNCFKTDGATFLKYKNAESVYTNLVEPLGVDISIDVPIAFLDKMDPTPGAPNLCFVTDGEISDVHADDLAKKATELGVIFNHAELVIISHDSSSKKNLEKNSYKFGSITSSFKKMANSYTETVMFPYSKDLKFSVSCNKGDLDLPEPEKVTKEFLVKYRNSLKFAPNQEKIEAIKKIKEFKVKLSKDNGTTTPVIKVRDFKILKEMIVKAGKQDIIKELDVTINLISQGTDFSEFIKTKEEVVMKDSVKKLLEETTPDEAAPGTEEFECPIMMNTSTPCILIDEGKPLFHDLSKKELNLYNQFPYKILDNKAMMETLKTRVATITGLDFVKVMSNQSGFQNPFTKRQVIDVIPLTLNNRGSIDRAVKKLFFGSSTSSISTKVNHTELYSILTLALKRQGRDIQVDTMVSNTKTWFVQGTPGFIDGVSMSQADWLWFVLNSHEEFPSLFKKYANSIVSLRAISKMIGESPLPREVITTQDALRRNYNTISRTKRGKVTKVKK